MFRNVTIIGLVLVLVGAVLHCLSTRAKAKKQAEGEKVCFMVCIIRKILRFITIFLLEQKLSLLGSVRHLLYLLALLCFFVLVITGFYPVLILDKALSGYLMMIHATFAPVFAACLAALAVLCANQCRLGEDDFPWLMRFVRRQKINDDSAVRKGKFGQRLTFWVMIFLALPLILSVVVSMFPIFGTEGQEFLLGLHRYTALVFVLIAVVHLYLVVRGRMREE